MNETLAAAQNLFAQQRVQKAGEAHRGRRTFLGWTWMEAVFGAGLASTASVLAFVLFPTFMRAPGPQDDLIPEDYFRRGANPSPGMRPAGLDLITELEPYRFGGLQLGARNVEDRFGIYFVQPSGIEQEILSGRKSANETAIVSDALLLKMGEEDVLVVRSGLGDQQRWDAFVHDGFGFAVSGALSRQVWDATGREDVLERLSRGP